MKHITLGCLAAILSLAVRGADAPQQCPETLQGNWNSVDGSQQWVYGLHPTLAVWQNTFWDYAGITTEGAVTAIRLRERGGDRTATLYARWNRKDSTAMIGTSPRSLVPYSRTQIADPSYRIPADEDPGYPSGDSILRDGIAVVRGYLDGYSPETMARTIKIYGFNTVTGQELPAVGDIAADGAFEMTVELGHPVTTQISLAGTFYDNLYLEPGDTLTLYYDIPDQRQSAAGQLSRYMGRNGYVNRELNALRRLYLPFGREDQLFLMRTTPDSIRAWIGERTARDSAATEKYIAENGISRKGAFLARWTPAVLNGERLGLYAMYRERKDPVDTSFYDFYRSLPLDDPRLLGIDSYRYLINRLEFCPLYWKSTPVLLDFGTLVREGFPIDSEDLPRIDSLERRLYVVPGDSAATAQAYERAWEPLYGKYRAFFEARNMVRQGRQVYESGDAYWGRPMPFLNDLIAARRSHGTLQRTDRNIPNRWLAMILREFSSPYAIATLLDANDALRPEPVAAAAGPYVPADRAEKLLDSLLREHRGRAVCVDFWSTGCGPCRQGMMESWRLKEKLKGQPVDFVYITSTDQSPEKIAADFIEKNKITGRQIRLTPDEWNILAAKYRINGIPHYMVVGPDGRVLDPHFMGYYDKAKAVSTLLKAAGADDE